MSWRTRSRPYQICVRCVMDTTDEEISFDAQGRCNHCAAFFEKAKTLLYRGAETDVKREAILDRVRAAGRGRAYDCVLGISGGIDSAYAALKAKQLGLRPLLVHMDNGWDSATAVRNIKLVVDKLGLDYQSYVLDWEDFRALQVAFLRASLLDAEMPTDTAIPTACHAVAAEHGIKYVIGGGNTATEGILPRSWGYDAKDVRLIRAVQKRFGAAHVKSFPTFGLPTELYYKLVKGISIVYLLNYLPFEKGAAAAELERELGWRYIPGKHHESRYTRFLQSYILPVKFDLDYRRATFSSQICAGTMTRDEALDELERLPYDPDGVEDDKRYVCKKLRLSRDEFESIMGAEPMSYRDYPNAERWLEVAYGIYRRLQTLKPK